MSVKHKGIGVAWGVSSTGYTYTGSSTVLNAVGISQSLKKSAEMSFHKDPATGDTTGAAIFDQNSEVSLKVFPSGPSVAAAKTAGGITPAIGDKFAVTDTEDTEMAGTTYIVMSVSKERKVGDRVEFDITIKKWANDISADVT